MDLEQLKKDTKEILVDVLEKKAVSAKDRF